MSDDQTPETQRTSVAVVEGGMSFLNREAAELQAGKGSVGEPTLALRYCVQPPIYVPVEDIERARAAFKEYFQDDLELVRMVFEEIAERDISSVIVEITILPDGEKANDLGGTLPSVLPYIPSEIVRAARRLLADPAYKQIGLSIDPASSGEGYDIAISLDLAERVLDFEGFLREFASKFSAAMGE